MVAASTGAISLNNDALKHLPEGVSGPNYDRNSITAGMIHIGLGNFHRAHQAWYLHRLMQSGEALDWGVLGAGVREYDAKQREKLAAQDYLTTLIELDPAGCSAEVTGAMCGFVEVAQGHGPLIEAMAAPEIRIISLTVTEGGYYLSPSTKQFDQNHPDIQADIASPQSPATVFGAIVAALRLRRDRDLGPVTLMSCDNLPGNGTLLRSVVLGLAGLMDQPLADWIARSCTFPNSMVDCIVPATGARELELAKSFGIADTAPVTHENFRQWVIEDNFCAGRPAWEKVGATFTDDVHNFEAMKLRLLNGGHQVIADPAEVLGIVTISETMAHPLIRAFFRKVALEEIAPHVQDVPDMTPQAYVDLIDRRFSNPEIADTVRRVAFDGSSRHTGAVLPVIRDAIAAGTPVSGLALVQALWARMCAGEREDGSRIETNDPIWDRLQTVAQEARTRPECWLEMADIYGDIAADTRFAQAFSHWMDVIWTHGTEAAMSAYLKG